MSARTICTGVWPPSASLARLHARQTALADYYRNIHLWFELGAERSELDTFAEEDARYQQLRWRRGEWFEKLYLLFYRRYTLGQEQQTPRFQAFYHALRQHYGTDVPDQFRRRFREQSRPLMKFCNILTFDTRVVQSVSSSFSSMCQAFHNELKEDETD